MMGVEIESEGAAARRRETLRHPEREFGGAAPADQPLLAPQGPHPENALAPVFGMKADVIDRTRPWHRAHDRDLRPVDVGRPADRRRRRGQADRRHAGRHRERGGTRGPTPAPWGEARWRYAAAAPGGGPWAR